MDWLEPQASPQIFHHVIVRLYNFQYQMSIRGSPIRGLQPSIKEFTIQNYTLNSQNERLAQLLIAKNSEVQELIETNSKLKINYEAQANAYRRTIESLERQLGNNQISRQAEFNDIKERYSQLTKEEMANLKNSHTSEIEFLFKEIAQLRATIQTYNSKLDVKDHEIITIKSSFQRQLALSVSEVSMLNKKIMQHQDDRLREVKELTNRRQLEKSRTSGVVNSRKESTIYIEKQLRKLNEDVLQKTIAVQNIGREMAREKKKHDEAIKVMNQKIQSLNEDYKNQLEQKEKYFLKIEKIIKDELLQYKQKQIKLLNENENLRSSTNLLKKDVQTKETVIKSKADQVQTLKSIIEKMREQHITEINNLMKERRKRSSKSNLGSSRSLTSSLKESAIIASANTPPPIDTNQHFANKFAGFLPTVKQQASPERKDLSHELSHSNIVQEQNENQLARFILHHDTVIDQLKRSHEMELEYYKMSIDKAEVKLKLKQNELEDVLTRFSPLVKIHADEKSIEEDRKDRIERHWKADLSILEIMLSKYRIRTF